MSSENITSNKFDNVRIDLQLKKWRERLLDLSKNNPLLGINRSRMSKLQVKEKDGASLFSRIVINGDVLKMPLVKRNPPNKDVDELQGISEIEGLDEYEIIEGDIAFNAIPKDLRRLQRRIYDNGRMTVEERGVTTLHLTFGQLLWFDQALGESISPIILVPCEIVNHGPSAHMRLKMTDEEVQINPALELFLREKHHIKLPALDDQPNLETLQSILSQIASSVAEPGWKVEEAIWLSTFSFESLVIYKDLEAMTELSQTNPVIAAFAQARMINEKSEALGDNLDKLEIPKIVPVPVLPADASQLHALTMVSLGKHVVVHGPPGTGKSQTICNLIADAIGRGKRVLFVSAKMAALDVVYDRLVSLGLQRFCLEAHSTKAGKTKIIEELKRTLELSSNGENDEFNNQLDNLKRIRVRLNEYVREIHIKRKPLEMTIYQAIGKLEKLFGFPTVESDLPWENILDCSHSQIRDITELLEDLSLRADVYAKKHFHPWRGVKIEETEPFDIDSIKKNLSIMVELLERLNCFVAEMKVIMVPTEDEFNLSDLRNLLPIFESLVKCEKLPSMWLDSSSVEIEQLEKLCIAGKEKSEKYHIIKSQVKSITSYDAHELYDLLQLLDHKFKYWTRIFNLKYWKWRSEVKSKLLANVNLFLLHFWPIVSFQRQLWK